VRTTCRQTAALVCFSTSSVAFSSLVQKDLRIRYSSLVILMSAFSCKRYAQLPHRALF